MWSEGIYLAPDPERARLYGDNVMAFYVKANTNNRTAKRTGRERNYTAMANGDIFVYSPNQIKSATDNIGTFDRSTPDIRFSARKGDASAESDYADYDTPITQADVQVLRDMAAEHKEASGNGRVSINDFTSEGIKRAQKWANRFWRQLGTKSPFFRVWFGDWRARDVSPVEVAYIPDYIDTNEARKAQRGNVRNSDTKWDIRISREGETNTISHSGAEGLLKQGLSGIRSLVENAVLLNSEVHVHHSNNARNDIIAFDHKLYALGRDTEGNIAVYCITVEETYQDPYHTNEIRFHNLKYIKKVAELSADANVEQSYKDGSTMRNSTTAYSVADLYKFVKQYDKGFSAGKEVNPAFLNEDGTPKVFYHGTDAVWTEYDLTKNKNQMWGEGIYLVPDPERARLYGDNVMAFYVKADTNNRTAKRTGRERDYTAMANGDILVYSPNQIKSATENYSKFGNLYDALDNGNSSNIQAAIRELLAHGVKLSTIKGQLTKKYGSSEILNGYVGYEECKRYCGTAIIKHQ